MEEKPKTYIKVYPINPPNAYVGIYVDPLTKQYRYEVLEPKLFPKEMKIFNRIKEILYEELDIEATNLKREEMEKYLEEKIKEIIKKYKIRITEETIAKIMYYVKRDFTGYSKIDVPMRDSNIEDITCDGAGTPIYVWHREYWSRQFKAIVEWLLELGCFVIRVTYKAGKHVSVSQPIVDGALPDGSRVQVTFGKEVSLKGSSFTIRKFKRDPLTIVDLIKNHTLSTEMAAFFWFIIENRASILISGGVAAGKTTLLNALAIFIPPEFKIISIEE
ncbi:MAG: type II/IV secretion system ATPase subunit, partial [Candidatus Verstraetearchaeota archaeon]|nr:type II/IV secretion system ATPase subunit [Candidatus Verstraetearchaeota archaeon]